MELIIGRDASTSQLRITMGQQSKTFGVAGSVPRSTNHSLLPFPDYERKSKKIISISQISKPTLYEMPFYMYQMTKRMLDPLRTNSVPSPYQLLVSA